VDLAHDASRNSGKVDIQRIVTYHKRIIRTAKLAGLKSPSTTKGRGRRSSLSDWESDSESDSSSDSRSLVSDTGRLTGPPPPPPPPRPRPLAGMIFKTMSLKKDHMYPSAYSNS
jgi:hypothetical protein